jgi:hypothetical protein
MPATPVEAQEARRNVEASSADVIYVFILFLCLFFLKAEADASAEAVVGIVFRDE